MLQRADAWTVRGRAAAAAAFVVALLAWHAAYPAVDAWVRAGVVLGDVVLNLPVRPSTWVTADPVVEEMSWAGGGYGPLTLPSGEGGHPALIFVLGARAAEPDDPRVVRLRDALARAGFAVLIHQSDALKAGRVEPAEVDRLVAAFEAVEAHGNVNAGHVGYVGLSAGGSLVAIAAARPAIAERVRFVLAIGPYYDAETLAADVVSETMRTPEGIEPWHPRSIARYVVRETLLSTLPDGERAAIEAEREPEGEQARAVAELLNGTSRERAEELLAGLEGTEAHLHAVSPRYTLGGLRAPLYLVHDVADEFIPWVESERLAEAHRPAVYHRTEIFEHVEPRIDSMGVVARDGWRLFRLFTRVIRDSGLPR